MSNTSLVVKPFEGITIYDQVDEDSAFPVTNALSNRYGLVARSDTGAQNNVFQARFNLGSIKTFDTIAVLWHNLRDSDVIRFRTSGDIGFTTDVFTSGNLLPVSGTSASDEVVPRKIVYQFPTPRSAQYLEVMCQILGSAHPDGFHQYSRVIIGNSIQIGVGPQSLEHSVSDPGEVVINEAGYESADEGGLRVPMIKAVYEWATEAEFKADLRPFVQEVGRTKPFLYIPDFTDPNVQDSIVFGRNRSPALASSKYDVWKQEINVKSIGP